MYLNHERAFTINLCCPVCKNYFLNSEICSYSIFDPDYYTDGYMCYIPTFRITRCPKCLSYFNKRHLEHLGKTVHYDDVPKKDRPLLGHVVGYFRKDEPKALFIERALEKGLYFPSDVTEEEKHSTYFHLCRDLWHEYNLRRDTVDDIRYTSLCIELIAILESVPNDRTRNLPYKEKMQTIQSAPLTLAELYRNVGAFDRCLKILYAMPLKSYDVGLALKIRKEALTGNTRTVFFGQRITRVQLKYFNFIKKDQ